MWERKRQDSPAEPGAPPATPERLAARTEPTPSRGTAIGKAVAIIGEITSEEDLFVDGEVQGDLNVKGSRLTIGPNGKAKSNVKAHEVIIQGQVQGDVEATQKIVIRREGSLVGNIRTTGIVIEDDAYFKGSIDIVRNHKDFQNS